MQLLWPLLLYIVHACSSTHTDKGISGWDPRTSSAVQHALITHRKKQCACIRGILRSRCILPPKFLTLQRNRRLGQPLELPPPLGLSPLGYKNSTESQFSRTSARPSARAASGVSVSPPSCHTPHDLLLVLFDIDPRLLSLHWWHREQNRDLNAYSCEPTFLSELR